MSTHSSYQAPLAKSEPQETLDQHTHAVIEAVSAMVNALRPFLPNDIPNLAIECARLHDVGKIAKGFQQTLRTGKRWEHRHEALSAAVALALELPEEVCLAIMTHHRPANHSCFDPYKNSPQWQKHGLRQWKALLEEMTPYWGWLRTVLLANTSPPLPDNPATLPALHDLLNQAHSSHLRQRDWEFRQRLIWLRGLLMAGDHLASGHGTTLPTLANADVFPRSRSWHLYQQQMQKVNGHVLLQAPTGAGKTESALLWALHNRQAEERIFYVLPTQASIEAMVQRLRQQFGEEAVAPLHHRVIDLEFQRHFESDPDSDYTRAHQHARKTTDRYRQFYSPIKVLTPHQIIKHMFGGRFFEVGLTELTGALVILDEIHAYDVHVSALLEGTMCYLSQQFGTRFCVMSATMPTPLQRRMQGALGNAVNFLEPDPNREADLLRPRHQLCLLDQTLELAIPQILSDLRTGRSVLVVANRVPQAQALYRELKQHEPNSLLLHSRFVRCDRARIENQLLENPPKLLVATQAVEVSLDISFDTCYTELAPADDLLQRFGRVNRRGEHPKPVPVYVCTQYDQDLLRRIYPAERLQATLQSAPDNHLLDWQTARQWVEAVYANGFTPKEQNLYNQVIKSFCHVLDSLVPLHEIGQVDFENLFYVAEVVPESLAETYRTHHAERRYLLANQYLTSLPIGMLHALNSQGLVAQENNLYVVQCAYDSELGLQTDTPDRGSAWIV